MQAQRKPVLAVPSYFHLLTNPLTKVIPVAQPNEDGAQKKVLL